jgi:hypothetical protein
MSHPNLRWLLLSLCLMGLATFSVGCDSGEPGADSGPDESCPPEGLSSCDPIEQTCCDPYEYCMVYQSAGRYRDGCRNSQGDVPEGGSCLILEISGDRACRAGLTCILIQGVDSQANCHRLCRDDTDCIEGTCQHQLEGQEVIKACSR